MIPCIAMNNEQFNTLPLSIFLLLFWPGQQTLFTFIYCLTNVFQ